MLTRIRKKKMRKRLRPPRRRRNNHVVLVVLGWLFLGLGVAGLFLPVLQGVLFLLVGVYLLSILLGLATIIQVLRFQAIRIREVAAERAAS